MGDFWSTRGSPSRPKVHLTICKMHFDLVPGLRGSPGSKSLTKCKMLLIWWLIVRGLPGRPGKMLLRWPPEAKSLPNVKCILLIVRLLASRRLPGPPWSTREPLTKSQNQKHFDLVSFWPLGARPVEPPESKSLTKCKMHFDLVAFGLGPLGAPPGPLTMCKMHFDLAAFGP